PRRSTTPPASSRRTPHGTRRGTTPSRVTGTRNGTALTTNVAQAREALGAHLRQLRRDADMTGRELAAACGWLPSKVSKIENGKQSPSPADIRAWAHAAGHPEAEAALRAELATLESFFRDWRRQLK